MLNKQINKKPTPIKEDKDKIKSRVQTTIKIGKSNNKENRDVREILMIQVYGGSHIK